MQEIRFKDAGHLASISGRFGEDCWLVTDAVGGELTRVLHIARQGGQPVVDGCRITIPRTAKGNIRVLVGHDGARVTFGAEVRCSMDLILWREPVVEIGDFTTCNGARLVCDSADVRIGADCMLSDEILIQSHEQHGLFDLDRWTLTNTERRSLVIEDHAWIGRRATLMPGVSIGHGGVVGTGAVVVKDTEPFTYNVGVPSRAVRSRASWTRSPEAISPREAAFFRASGFAPPAP